jgi:phosphotriesterase-related protein
VNAIVRTVLGDVDPARLGLTLGHEHLITHPPAEVSDPDLRLDDEEAALRELEAFRQAGGGAVIEMTTVDYGRDGAALERLARASAVHIVAATGFNKGKFADRLTESRTVEEIAAWMIAEVREGLRGFSPEQPHREESRARAGLIKASSSLNGANPNELKVFEAAIQAHHVSGAPISTHTEKGSWALEQAECFLRGGVDPRKVLIGHLDLKPDLPYLLEVAATGVNLGLDQFSKEKYLPDATRVGLVAALVEAGFGQQILIGGDLARRSYWRAFGHPYGFTFIPTQVKPLLEEAGLSEEQIEDILVSNPRRFLAMSNEQ